MTETAMSIEKNDANVLHIDIFGYCFIKKEDKRTVKGIIATRCRGPKDHPPSQ
ncbi:MAG: hypothetical protein L6Q53_11215 [Candidatus Brocadia sinica]|uniref:Uncharacterized protein n=1 Tax=Candidatus Brocadia sinica JPN1 TaxID=1197129 RepID=A0ABQ0K2I7_9BACT|nr:MULTISPECIES: hypothetical protein [Brocadia]MCK6468748.1 hypothetical protein [Candidatus Brocadia sinica]NOG42759.1 hypothetical protein [Planctomycetota bacterium]NUO05010.1 hypothetical protein [Candidatus Brocadia sinica]GAN34979.1 hypothetical protein BROSI_A3524 [Candidatus Brocadia sinica JPN1]GIK11993.1 MAG: hypothetical protein BroJett002_07000 [Candidatus Brocadia sinica]